MLRHILALMRLKPRGDCDDPLIGFYCATKWAVEALHERRTRRSGGQRGAILADRVTPTPD